MKTRSLMPALFVTLVATAAPAHAQLLGPEFVSTGNPVIRTVVVVPIFWGPQWDSTAVLSPALKLVDGLDEIMQSSYFAGLAQYGALGGAVDRHSQTNPLVVDSSSPPSPFTFQNIWDQLIKPAIDAGKVPSPTDNTGNPYLYVAFMPQGSTPPTGQGGAHTLFDYNGTNAHVAWVAYGTQNQMTTRFSHELAEAVTNPEGQSNFFIGDGCGNQPGWCEIGDACVNYPAAKLNNAYVQAYWSAKDNACIIPTLSVPQLPRWWLLPPETVSGGGAFQGGLSAALSGDGRLELFARGDDGGVWTAPQTDDPGWWNGTDWGWTALSLPIGAGELISATNADGRVEVFALDNHGVLWHDWETSPGGTWSGWYSIGGHWVGTPRVARNQNGLLQVFVSDVGGRLSTIVQSGATDWGQAFSSLGGTVASGQFLLPLFDVATNADGRLELFAIYPDGSVQHNWQLYDNAPANAWSGWYSLGGNANLLAVGRNQNGLLQLFVRGSDKKLWTIVQSSATDFGKAWYSLSGRTGLDLQGTALVVGTNADGRLEVFTLGLANVNSVWHIWQNHVNAAANDWSRWGSLGGSFRQITVGTNPDGRMELFGSSLSGLNVYHLWQNVPSGGWDY
jgi:hypothetical protein